jgi:predicted DCC family thiol-disulfide oxidoreductase YuxK
MRYARSVTGDGRSIVLIDGECNVCESTARFVIPRDPNGRFVFAPLQSETGRALLEKAGLPRDTLDGVVLIENDRVYLRSTAILRIVRGLSGVWPLLRVFLLVPRPVRDAAYDAFAARRYRWFGKKDSCLVPTPDIAARCLA